VLGKAPTVVLCSSSKDALNRIAVAGGLDLDPKRSGVEIQKKQGDHVLFRMCFAADLLIQSYCPSS
jgi:hypothetical protein